MSENKFVTVPAEPTLEMVYAAAMVQKKEKENIKEMYQAMIAAAPASTAQDFDSWAKHPYTLTLQKNIAEDYVPRAAQAWAVAEPLERVIAEQQAEIDSLRNHNAALMASSTKAALNRHERDTALFKDIDKLLDFKLLPYWKDDQAEAFKQYGALLHELRMHLLENGWCIRCSDFGHSCGCNDE